jgi:hypothetical protein
MSVQNDHKCPVHGLVMELVQNVDIDSKPDLVLYKCPRDDYYYSPGTEKIFNNPGTAEGRLRSSRRIIRRL